MSVAVAATEAFVEDAVVARMDGVSKAFGHGSGAMLVLRDVSLELRRGEFTCLVGASGSGKTTILNLLAGLEAPTAGTVAIDGVRRALMFQEGAVFPWLTAAGNIELPLRLRAIARGERRRRVEELLALVQLEGFGHLRPHELSGGMRQRVALARALAQDAELLLMDEPFGALDAITRDLLHDELERICGERRLTVLFVTHNAREAARLGDRVLVLSSRPGRIATEVPVRLRRPRRMDSPELAGVSGDVGEQLRREVRSHAS
jgi:NitT/TauT family transport system ATP-binding protein